MTGVVWTSRKGLKQGASLVVVSSPLRLFWRFWHYFLVSEVREPDDHVLGDYIYGEGE